MRDERVFYLFSFSNASVNKVEYVSTDMYKLLDLRSKNDLKLILGWAEDWDEFKKDRLNKGGWEEIK